jgi:hypothetical protein
MEKAARRAALLLPSPALPCPFSAGLQPATASIAVAAGSSSAVR